MLLTKEWRKREKKTKCIVVSSFVRWAKECFTRVSVADDVVLDAPPTGPWVGAVGARVATPNDMFGCSFGAEPLHPS